MWGIYCLVAVEYWFLGRVLAWLLVVKGMGVRADALRCVLLSADASGSPKKVS